MQSQKREEIEIDIKELLYILLHKAWIIILAGIILALCGGLLSKLFMKPIYTSNTKLYIINRQNKETTTIYDLQTGTQLTMDYKVLVLSRPVTERVIKDLNLSMSNEELVSDITVKTATDTRILEIQVNNEDPVLAKKMADSIAEVSAERMMTVMEMEKANIVEPGNIPVFPSSPDIFKNSVLGGLAGIFLSIFVLVLLYIMNDTIKSNDDIERYLRLNTLGAMPLEVPAGAKKVKKSRGSHKGKENLNSDKHSFISSEAYKSLRTNIQFCGKDVKSICITSSTPNEGKTVVSFRLASVIAESGKKVLFIDADLRKSVILGRLKIDRAVNGLSQYLSGMKTLEEIINKTKVPNVDIIFTGPIPPNPSELLGSDMFNELLQSQREIYDYIIIDTPPLGVVIDGVNVAEFCDGTIMVVESNRISYKLAQRVLFQLKLGECRVLGAVLNKVDMEHKGYYNKYYGKEYGKYYGKYEFQS